MIIYKGYSDDRFLELSEFECKTELELELWRRLNDVYIGYETEDSEYFGMTHKELIDEINSIKSDNEILESELAEVTNERDDFEEALEESNEDYGKLECVLHETEESHRILETSYVHIISEYLNQICVENESNEELVSKITQAKHEIELHHYELALDLLNEICYDDIKNRYPLLSTILYEIEQYGTSYFI